MMKRTLLPAAFLLALLAGARTDAVTSPPEIASSDDPLRSGGGDSESMLLASAFSDARQFGPEQWDVLAHEQRHVDLYVQNRHILHAEAERTMAHGLTSTEWKTMLGPQGSAAVGLGDRQHELQGGLHRAEDGFPAQSCVLDLLAND